MFERSEISPFARCFVIFNKSLTKQYNWLEERKQFLIKDLNIDLHILYKEKVENKIEWRDDKPFSTFLFTLSSLNILNGKLTDQNLEILKKILDTDFKKNLEKKGVHRGTAKSGNHSMFFAIFNIYANNYLNIDRTKQIKDWLEFNSNTINSNGFWGKKVYMDYLQFQNGYHQYEIFEYLEFNKVSWNNAARKTLLMSDKLGHFAPWPGGGACYDYDAIFMLTSKFVNDFGQQNVLKKTLNSIIDEQNDDGGFCESKYMRRNVLIKFINMINHIIFQPKHVKLRSIF